MTGRGKHVGGLGLGKGAKGLGGVQRHRKVTGDNIQGMTRPMYQRLGKRAGAVRLEGNVYETLRGYTKEFLRKILHVAVILMEHQRMRTLTFKHIEMALQLTTNMQFLGGKETANRGAPFVVSHAPKKKTEGKVHRYKPGTVALREVRAYQKNSDKAAIPFQPFFRLVKEILQDFHEDVRLEAGGVYLLRFLTESYITWLVESATKVAVHSGRVSVAAKDLQLVMAMMMH